MLVAAQDLSSSCSERGVLPLDMILEIQLSVTISDLPCIRYLTISYALLLPILVPNVQGLYDNEKLG